MRIKVWDKKNKRMWDVTEIKWRSRSQGGEMFYIRGNTEYHGLKEAPIGAHEDYCDLSQLIIIPYWRLRNERD